MANEKRLIDAYELIEHLEKCIATTNRNDRAVCLCIKCFVDLMQVVDAVEVVRCKDCKHFNMQRMECENDYVSTDNEGGADYSINFGPDDFCSYGERKDNEI